MRVHVRRQRWDGGCLVDAAEGLNQNTCAKEAFLSPRFDAPGGHGTRARARKPGDRGMPLRIRAMWNVHSREHAAAVWSWADALAC